MSPGVRGLGPPGVPPAPSPVQSASWMRVRQDPSLVDHPPARLCGDLTPNNRQPIPKTIGTQNCPPGPPRPQHCSFHCSPQVGREPAGHPDSSGGPGGCMVTVSAAFQGSRDQVRTWQDLAELPAQHNTPSPVG